MKGSFSSFKGFLSATPLGNILRRAEKEIEFGRKKVIVTIGSSSKLAILLKSLTGKVYFRRQKSNCIF
jgi:hypothetical protein